MKQITESNKKEESYSELRIKSLSSERDSFENNLEEVSLFQIFPERKVTEYPSIRILGYNQYLIKYLEINFKHTYDSTGLLHRIKVNDNQKMLFEFIGKNCKNEGELRVKSMNGKFIGFVRSDLGLEIKKSNIVFFNSISIKQFYCIPLLNFFGKCGFGISDPVFNYYSIYNLENKIVGKISYNGCCHRMNNVGVQFEIDNKNEDKLAFLSMGIYFYLLLFLRRNC